MASVADLTNMDVDELFALRGDVESELKERARDLERQIALLGDDDAGNGKRRGRPAGGDVATSTLKGTTVPPKYRGPNGETWAGRGAMPRWLAALVKEGHSVEEFLIGAGRRKAAAAARRTAVKKRIVKKKVAKPVRNPQRSKVSEFAMMGK